MTHPSICPWWLRFTLLAPLRRAMGNPDEFLKKWVKSDMVVADIGCGTGFLTIPLARVVGKNGKVIAVDLQPRMLESTRLAARKAGVEDHILFQQNISEAPRASSIWDGAVLVWMLHEVLGKVELLKEISGKLKPDGFILFVEPIFHVSNKQFLIECELFRNLGFSRESQPHIALSRCTVFRVKKK